MEKPILFNTEMVKAILEGKKTSTRRIVKSQPKHSVDNISMYDGIVSFNERELSRDDVCESTIVKKPYHIGDILWVRETWNALDVDWKHPGNHFAITEGPWPNIIYKADCIHKFSWIPSIHMPRWAARLFLKVTDVRIERLQDISEDGAIKEGFEEVPEVFTSKELFQATWNSIYKNWNENPWVWVIEFERVEV